MTDKTDTTDELSSRNRGITRLLSLSTVAGVALLALLVVVSGIWLPALPDGLNSAHNGVAAAGSTFSDSFEDEPADSGVPDAWENQTSYSADTIEVSSSKADDGSQSFHAIGTTSNTPIIVRPQKQPRNSLSTANISGALFVNDTAKDSDPVATKLVAKESNTRILNVKLQKSGLVYVDSSGSDVTLDSNVGQDEWVTVTIYDIDPSSNTFSVTWSGSSSGSQSGLEFRNTGDGYDSTPVVVEDEAYVDSYSSGNWETSDDSSSSGYTQTFRLDDHSGNYPNPEFTVKKPDLTEYQGSKVLTKGDQWQTVDSTTFNHNDRAYVELANDTYYLLSLRDGGALYEQSGFQGNHSNDIHVIQPGRNESVKTTNATATPTATPFNTSRDNVSVTPYDGGIRLTYDGEEPLDDFDYSLEGPDDKTYNVSRDFEEPTDYFQSDLEDPLIDNASENSEEYEVDWNSSTTDGEELGGEIDVGENQGYEFGAGGSDGGDGGGGGVVPTDSGGGSPIWVTAVPALAAIGYTVYRRRGNGT
jgi:hypothetical protein